MNKDKVSKIIKENSVWYFGINTEEERISLVTTEGNLPTLPDVIAIICTNKRARRLIKAHQARLVKPNPETTHFDILDNEYNGKTVICDISKYKYVLTKKVLLGHHRVFCFEIDEIGIDHLRTTGLPIYNFNYTTVPDFEMTISDFVTFCNDFGVYFEAKSAQFHAKYFYDFTSTISKKYLTKNKITYVKPEDEDINDFATDAIYTII